jgi:hypothetical protein
VLHQRVTESQPPRLRIDPQQVNGHQLVNRRPHRGGGPARDSRQRFRVERRAEYGCGFQHGPRVGGQHLHLGPQRRPDVGGQLLRLGSQRRPDVGWQLLQGVFQPRPSCGSGSRE